MDPAAEDRRRESLQRLAAATALEEADGYSAVDAWQLAAELPVSVRLQICTANRTPIRAMARENVERILRDFRRGQTTAPVG